MSDTGNPFVFTTAKRTAAPLKIGLSGASGSGKTWSSLLLASGMAKPEEIFLIDTEAGSAALYAGLVLDGYKHANLTAPYSPDRLRAAVKAAEQAGAKVIIVDSASLFWSGVGGILDTHEKLGGNFQTWAKTNVHYNMFKNTLFMNPMHTIITMRAKSDYAIGDGASGKKTVTKVGLKEDMRDLFEFELSCHLRLDANHNATVEKDRTRVFPDNGVPFTITKELGEQLLKFSKGE